jgi:hypothetical protein
MTAITMPRLKLLSFLVISCLFSWMLLPGLAHSEETVAAVAQSIQGGANEYQAGYKNIVKLNQGAKIEPFSVINTGAKSKLMLRWSEGLFSSLGESSSISSATERGRGPVDEIQMIQGIVRFTTDENVTNPAFAYTVVTPTVAIRPDTAGQPVDYVVEVDDPSTTILTVLSGKVRVKDNSNGTSKENVYESCKTVFFTQGKEPAVTTAYSGAVADMIAQTTLAGTLPAPAACPSGIAEQTAPSGPTPSELAPYMLDYYVDNNYVDFYPYDEIECYPYEEGYTAVFPDIGSWYIPYYYPISPAIVQIFCNDYLINQAVYIDEHFITNVRRREHQLQRAIAVATRTGNLALAAGAQNRLNLLEAREGWARHQRDGLRRRLNNLQTASARFRGQVPRGTDLTRAIAKSFASARNAGLARKFQDRLNNQLGLENRLTSLGQKQIEGLQAKLATIHDPSQRMALRNQVASMRQNLAQGKIPITAQERSIGTLARQLGKERTPSQHLALQNQLLSSLKESAPAAGATTLLNHETLSSLRSRIDQIPNSAFRRDLTNKVRSIERSTKVTKREEAMLSSPKAIVGANKQFEKKFGPLNQTLLSSKHPGPGNFRFQSPLGNAGQSELRHRFQVEPQTRLFGSPETWSHQRKPQFKARQFQQPHVSPPLATQRHFNVPHVQQPHGLSLPQTRSFTQRMAQPHLNLPYMQQPHVQSLPQARSFAQPHFSVPHVQQPHVQAMPQFHAAAPQFHAPAFHAPAFHPAPAPHGPHMALQRKH